MTNSPLSSSQQQFKTWMPYIALLACFVGAVVVFGWLFDPEGQWQPWLIFPTLAMVGFLTSLWVFLAPAYPATRLLLPMTTVFGLIFQALYLLFFILGDLLLESPVAAGIIALTITGGLGCYVFSLVLVYLLIMMGKAELGYRYTKAILALLPGWTFLRLTQALVLIWLQHYEAALADCNIVVEATQSGGFLARAIALDGHAMRCAAYGGLNEFEKALEDVSTIEKLRPNYEYIYIYRAYIHLHMNNLNAAESTLKKGFSLVATPRGEMYLLLYQGVLHYIQQTYEQAHHSFKAVLKIPAESDEDVHSQAYTYLGCMTFEQGDTATARTQLERACVLHKYSNKARAGLAIVRYSQGEHEAAVTIWRTMAVEHPRMKNADWVVQDYFQWTPKMAEVARQIIAEIAA
jgi:tetratricopeptide (TPR) repeat protein